MIDTVLFDIGGTLIKQTRNSQRSLLYSRFVKQTLSQIGTVITLDDQEFFDKLYNNQEVYKHRGETTFSELPPLEVWRDFILREYDITMDKLELVAESLSFTYDYIRMENSPRPNLRQSLEQLGSMGLKLGIITNTISRTFAEHILNEYKVLPFFPVIVKSCEFGIRKPHPAIFEHAMNMIGSTKETTCYVGDTISRDVLGSRNADLAMVIKIRNSSIAHRDTAFQGSDAPKADFEIDDLIEIPEIIETFNKERT